MSHDVEYSIIAECTSTHTLFSLAPQPGPKSGHESPCEGNIRQGIPHVRNQLHHHQAEEQDASSGNDRVRRQRYEEGHEEGEEVHDGGHGAHGHEHLLELLPRPRQEKRAADAQQASERKVEDERPRVSREQLSYPGA